MAVKTTLNKEQIIQRLRTHEAAIREFGVSKLGLFGSVVRGKETGESDIDILVEFIDGQKNFDNFMDLSFYLGDILEKKVQLVTRKSIADWILPNIVNEIEYVRYDH